MIENLAKRSTAEGRDPNLLALLPGSRVREIRKNFPVMLRAAAEIAAQKSDLRFEVAAASESLAGEIEVLVKRSSIRDRVRLVTGQSSSTMQRAGAGLVASGTATLESAFFRMPFVLVYKVSWPTYLAARCLMQTRFLGMPNVLAGREIVPEFLQHEARPKAIAAAVLPLLTDPARRDAMVRDFEEIIARLGETGASERAARAIMDELRSRG